MSSKGLNILLMLTALICNINISAAEPDANLGRLFNTPQRRAMLDGMRERNLQISPEQQGNSVRLDGIVRRSDGKNTVWLNGQALSSSPGRLDADTSSAEIPIGSKASARIKVGETIRTAPSVEQK